MAILTLIASGGSVFAKKRILPPVENPANRSYTVQGGVMRENAKPIHADSLAKFVLNTADSIVVDSLGITKTELDSLRMTFVTDSMNTAGEIAKEEGSAVLGTSQIDDPIVMLSPRQQRRMDKEARWADSSFVRHNKIFRDSMPISRVTAISLVVPGFSQVYNSQAWKVPVLYGTVATGLYFGLKQNKVYKSYKSQYDMLKKYGITDRGILDPVQNEMIKYNTRRQLLLVGALASYIYFIGDGAVNYPGQLTSVKKATTLSTIFPGAGQAFNKSYWKVPIVLGGMATFAYMIDWNNRGYKRFKTAYNIITDDDPSTVTEFYRNGAEPYNADFFKNLRSSYRRNRDLCIILAGGFYILNIIDAHVDAHLKDYDISDDLAINFEPTMFNYARNGRNTTMVGFNLSINF